MALIRCDFFSEALEVGTTMTVLLPQPAAGQVGVSGDTSDREPPVLYLLHGLTDDHTAWTRYTSIERHAGERGIAVVMPAVGRSFYADEVHGHRYWTFLSEELPSLVHRFFRVSPRRDDTFVAGLSMGGYGAVRLALRRPERFAAAASLSGAVDVVRLHEEGSRSELFTRVFGDSGPGPDDDPFALLERADVAALPRFYVGCGTEDELLPGSVRLLDELQRRGAPVQGDLRPGEHEWSLWDAMILDVLAWLPRRRGDDRDGGGR
jgi:S-formylglutathione hydrolase FrmB